MVCPLDPCCISLRTMDDVDNYILSLGKKYANFHPLLDSSVIIDDIEFIGGTLFTYFPEGKYKDAELEMNDYQYVTPEETIARHKNTVQYLSDNIKDQGKYVVVTHHLPSYTGISKEYKDSPSNYLFANHLDTLLRRASVKAWISGHTHSQNIVGKLHINPFGYPGECSRVLRSLLL